ncbi:hypothetical protein N2152v2_001610 [Parachlorella kessleri]
MGRHDDDSRRRDDTAGDAGAGGEVSMSIEETNRLRISLGLKPLKAEAPQPSGPSPEELRKQQEEERAVKADELAERVKVARERRRQQEALTATRTLGEADEEVDDVMAWVNKNRTLTAAQQEEKRRREAEQQAASRRRDQKDEDDDDEDDEYGGRYPGGHSAAELAGVKVKHTAEELEAGETMILTLEDKPILDEKGNLREEEDLVLENILAREVKDREKAWRAAGKQAKPLWEEDGRRRGLLDKYDQEEEEMMQIDQGGAIDAAVAAKRQDDIRARLAAGAVKLEDAAAAPEVKPASDFYSKEEMAQFARPCLQTTAISSPLQFAKPKKKKERKLKKKKALTAEEIAALEEEAAARGAGGSDLGSRAQRAERAQRKAAELANAEADRRQRFDQALDKANYASLALRDDRGAEGAVEEEEEEEDLYASLSKARQLALKKAQEDAAQGPESIAEQLIRRREEATKAAAAEGEGAGQAGLTFTDIAEFARNIQVKQEDEGREPGGAAVKQEPEGAADPRPSASQSKGAPPGEGVYGLKEEEPEGSEGMDVDGGDRSNGGGGSAADTVWAGWVPATKDEPSANDLKQKIKAKAKAGGKAQQPQQQGGEQQQDGGRKRQDDTDPVLGEKVIGTGLAGALAFLKDRGELSKPVEWAGRTNDSKKVNIQGLDDVYTGGRHEDRLARDVEVALTRKDEHGRILTPKEAFRQLCHRFHGIQPSKNTQEKRMRQVAQELAQKKVASGAGEAETVEHMKQVQKQAATPYVVLSGTVKPGQSRDATSGYATVERMEEAGVATVAPTPVLSMLGGGQTPLVGNAKVEAMLGLKRKGGSGSASMPPPAPKAPKRG